MSAPQLTDMAWHWLLRLDQALEPVCAVAIAHHVRSRLLHLGYIQSDWLGSRYVVEITDAGREILPQRPTR